MYVLYEKCFVRNDEINKLQQHQSYFRSGQFTNVPGRLTTVYVRTRAADIAIWRAPKMVLYLEKFSNQKYPD